MEFAEDDSDELEVVDEELLHMRKLLKTSLKDLDLSGNLLYKISS